MHHKSKKEARHDNGCVARNSERLGQYSQTREWETAGNAAYPQSNERQARLTMKHTRLRINGDGCGDVAEETRRPMARTEQELQISHNTKRRINMRMFSGQKKESAKLEAPPVLTSSVVPPSCSWQNKVT